MGLAVLSLAILAACSLPRGAAMVTEVVKEKDAENPTFQVVEVSRANVANLGRWPVTGWKGSYRWLSGTRGPVSSIIRPGDRVNLVIWESQENSLLSGPEQKSTPMNGLIVSPSGTIFVPYLDDVRVSGMTPDQARKKIQKDLAGIAPDAQVQLVRQSGMSNSVDLVSGVPKPGTYPLPNRNYSILSLIAQGGGIAPSLRNPLVRLIRHGKTYEIRAEKLFESGRTAVVLRGGDKVLVEEDRRYFTALGATGREQLVNFDREHVTALEAMSMIGGLSDGRANPKGVLILRDYAKRQLRSNGKGPGMRQVVFTLDLTTADGLFAARSFRVNPGDTVLATESPVTSVRTIFGLIGSVVGIANSASSS